MEVYLDYAASTPVYSEVVDTLVQSLKEDYANPSSAHRLGREALEKIDRARVYCLNLMSADKGDYFLFPSSATEANNTVIKALPLQKEDEIWVNFSDHASLVNSARSQENSFRGTLRNIPLENGFVQLDQLKNQISKKSKLIILALVNNHSGHIQDVNRIAKDLKEINPNLHVHVDAVQGCFKIPWKRSSDIDSVTISGHKLGGPKGVAGLFLKNNKIYLPLLSGGGQDLGLRSSTLATPMILAFQKALEIASPIYEGNFERAVGLQHFLREELSKLSPNIVFPFSFDPKKMSPYILTFYYKGIPGDVFLRHLEERGIFVSTASACSSKIKGEKEVYTYLGIPKTDHKFVLRISFGPDMTKEKLEYFINSCREIIKEWEDLFA